MRYSRSSSISVVIALAVLAAGCESPVATNPLPKGATLVEMNEQVLVRDYHTGVQDRRRLVVRDESAWTSLWSEIIANRQPKTPAPQVDFATEMVLAVSMGGRPTGGYSIDIDSFYEANGRLYVVVLETSPGSSCATTQAFTAPFVAVKLPRFDGEVVFAERAEVHECTD